MRMRTSTTSRGNHEDADLDNIKYNQSDSPNRPISGGSGDDNKIEIFGDPIYDEEEIDLDEALIEDQEPNLSDGSQQSDETITQFSTSLVTNEAGIPIMMRDQTRPPLDPLSATEISTVQVIGAIPEVRENKPLTKQEVCDLVREIARHPKLMEKKALRLSEELNKKLDRVESLLQKLESYRKPKRGKRKVSIPRSIQDSQRRTREVEMTTNYSGPTTNFFSHYSPL
ncbi:hypothetical protein ZIOFF_005321 [Zingiber officinale]|uniref:Uncharacterized protein n=1 Tax=Zingiber officinale TaxID=94328 RepID=A0A8J5LUT1_ZINOF|nr:hypothetical protein ZIOFF_005321 [Zingiber officinale]